jgi:hypothetical protein
MSYIFNRETVRYVLCRQRVIVDAGEGESNVAHTIELDDGVASSEGVLRVVVDGIDVEFEIPDDRHITVEATGIFTIDVVRECQITVREANRLIGIRRANYVQEAWDWLKAHGYELNEVGDVPQVPDEIWQTFIVSRFERAACMAAIETMTGVPQEWLTIEGFSRLLPEIFLINWASTVYRLNPHWERLIEYANEGEEEKKAG